MGFDIDSMIAKLEVQQTLITKLKEIKELRTKLAQLESELPPMLLAEMNGLSGGEIKKRKKRTTDRLDETTIGVAGEEMVKFLSNHVKSGKGAMFSTIRKHLNDKGIKVEGFHIGQIATTAPFDKYIERVPDMNPPFYKITGEGKKHLAQMGK